MTESPFAAFGKSRACGPTRFLCSVAELFSLFLRPHLSCISLIPSCVHCLRICAAAAGATLRGAGAGRRRAFLRAFSSAFPSIFVYTASFRKMSYYQGPPVGAPPPQFAPQGYPPQGYPQQGYPPQGYPQQGYPQQGYPPQQYDNNQSKSPSFCEAFLAALCCCCLLDACF